MSELPARHRDVTLVELVDRLLGKGVVISGEITLAVADIDLVNVELRALIASADAIGRRVP
ncbi:MAG: gas vesicle protein [Thermoleophilaceae bacterium]